MIINQEQLLEATGYENAGSAEKCLLSQGVPVMRGKGGRIFTTSNALDHALFDKPIEKQQLDIDD